MKTAASASTVILFLLFTFDAQAQQLPVKRASLDDVLAAAKSNLRYDINEEQISKGKAQVRTPTVFAKTAVFAENEDLRPGDSKGILKIGLSQSVLWPGLYKAKKQLYGEQLKYYQLNVAALDIVIKRDVRAVFYQLWYLQDKQALFQRLDSIYKSLNDAAILKVKTGDSPGLDSIAANVKMRESIAFLNQVGNDIEIQQQTLMQLLNTIEVILPVPAPLEKIAMPDAVSDIVHPTLVVQKQNMNIAGAGIQVTKNENRPDFSGRFFSQRLYGLKDPYSGFSLTAAFPLFGANAYRHKVKAAHAEQALQQKQYEYDKQVFNTEQAQAWQEVRKSNTLLSFYETTGLRQAEEIIKASSLAYRSGEISFAELSQFLTQAIDIQKNYLEVLNAYNQSAIQYNYYINQ